MFLYGLTIFLSAFLLFQVQPIIAKAILPWFGGSASVWTTCMLFFQTGLLGGYSYSHYSVGRLSPKRQAMVHSGLLLLSLLSLPILPGVGWKPESGENPTGKILLLLTATVGLPYLLLSTTGPLVQAWYARAERTAAPYRLFALSNLASMLALLTYPVFIEPYLPTTWQGRIWSAAYLVFAALCAFTAWKASKFEPLTATATNPEASDGPAPRLAEKLYWIALAGCASALMLAITNHLTQDVASIPFLWIVPLTIYLLSFILTFDARGWYRRNLFLVLIVPALGIMSLLQDSAEHSLPLFIRTRLPIEVLNRVAAVQSYFASIQGTIVMFAIAFFVCCMFCHGELASRKPAAKYLTSFYLMLSIGGALGGVFVGLVAPYLFQNFFELPIAIALCTLLAYRAALEEPGVSLGQAMFSVPGVSLGIGMIAICAFLGLSAKRSVEGYLLVERNFYGSLRISENKVDGTDLTTYRTLLHGAINHGEQWMHPTRRREHLTYYCDGSGIGLAVGLGRTLPGGQQRPKKFGVLGLGAGSMAAFANAGDEIRFYEINPQVPLLGETLFSYYKDTPAKKSIAMGDGRLSLEREPNQNFDLLMMDAFSGDSIPIHLITREAFQIYLRHIKEDGVIVMHISNKFLDLQPVLARVAQELRLSAVTVETDDYGDGNCFGTTYVILARHPEVVQSLLNAGVPPGFKADVATWTDDYSNLYRIVKR
jgi:hypothetical protein